MDLPIEVDQDQIAEFCKRNHLILFAFVGSVLTDEFGPDSDVDVLFDYDAENVPSLFDVVRMERELSEIFGRRVDMRSPRSLGKYCQDDVIRNAFVQYAA